MRRTAEGLWQRQRWTGPSPDIAATDLLQANVGARAQTGGFTRIKAFFEFTNIVK